MKKKVLLIFTGTLMIIAAGFGNLSANVSSLTELTAIAGDYCVPDPNSDCFSSETGAIYHGYRLARGSEMEAQ